MIKTSIHLNETGDFIQIYESLVPLIRGLRIETKKGTFKILRVTQPNIVAEIPDCAVAVVRRLG